MPSQLGGNNMKAMGKVTLTLFLILITSLFLTSCSGIVTPGLQPDSGIDNVDELDYIHLAVPYEKYAGANWCLPASGAMNFKYFGENINQAEIANRVIVNGNSSVFRFISYAKDLGFEAIYNYLTIEDIKNLLREGIPVIAIQNYSLTLPYSHARVIIGYDNQRQEIITNDPTAGKDYRINYSTFKALNTGNNPNLCKVIVIFPKEVDAKNSVSSL